MSRLSSKHLAVRLRHPLTWILALASVLVLFIGYRGLSLASHAHLLVSRKVANVLSQGADLPAMADLLRSPHPHLELLSGLWLRLIPGDHGVALSLLSMLALLLCLNSLRRIISRHTQGHTLALSVACATFAFLPSTVAQLGGPSPTLMTCALFLMTWDLCTLRHQRWWQAVCSWVTGGLLLGSWSPMLLWACLVLLAHVLHRARPDSTPRGTIARSSIPAGVLLCVPMVPLCATLLHPGFFDGVRQGWLMTLEAGWLKGMSTPGLDAGGHWYGQGKLPWLTSLTRLIAHVPLVTCLMSLPGVLWLIRTTRTAHHMLLIMALPAMTLIVWATPGGDYGRVAQGTIFVSMIAMLVGHGVAWLSTQAQVRAWHRALVPSVCAVATFAALFPALTFWYTPAAWESSITGGAVRAQLEGDTHSPHLALPIAPLRRALEAHGVVTLYAGDLNPLVRAYEMPDVFISETLDEGAAQLGITPRFSPDAPTRPSVITQEKPLVFLGKPAAPSFFIALPRAPERSP